jgi:hypothetical protein
MHEDELSLDDRHGAGKQCKKAIKHLEVELSAC